MIKGNQEWWHGEDVLSNGENFVGYKAPARLSELGLDYPEMIETKPSIKGNKQNMYRFRFENTANFLPTLPDDTRQYVKYMLLHNKREVRRYKSVPIFSEDGRSVMGFRKVEEIING